MSDFEPLPARIRNGRVPRALPEITIFVVAFLARLIPAVFNGGFSGNYGYDASVYYAAASGMIHGRVPYRDFILLHPPGVMLFDAPFAWLGQLTSDHVGFVAANLTASLVSAVSATLVVRVAGHIGLPRAAALIGGLVYALWFGAIAAEYLARLEPLGNFFMLCGLLAYYKARSASRSPRGAAVLQIASGVAFGAALSVKLWWVIPFVVVLIWQLGVERAYRRAALTMLGAVVVMIAVDGPFVLLARSRMWSMIVLDQLSRPSGNNDLLKPFGYLVFGQSTGSAPGAVLVVLVVVGGAGLAWAAWRSWRIPAARLIVVVLLAQLVQLGAEPSWFTFYADFITVPLALLIAAAAAPAVRERVGAVPPLERARIGKAPVGVAVALLVLLALALPRTLIESFPRARLAKAVATSRCVMSDSPMALIELDALARSFRPGCRNWVDVTGDRYEIDRLHRHAPRGANYMQYNRDMLAYLSTGDALIFMHDPKMIGLGESTIYQLERGGVLATAGQFTIFRILPSAHLVP